MARRLGKSQQSVCEVVSECLPLRAVQVDDSSPHLLAFANTGSYSVKSLSSFSLRVGLGCADWARTAFMWTSAFSGSSWWKCRCAYWYERLHQAISASRYSSLCWPARCLTTRLETRTKESIHMCEYVSSKLVCVMKVTVGT